MKKAVSFILLFPLLILFLPVQPHAEEAAAPASDPAASINITGDDVEYFYEENRAVGKGNIKIDYEGWTLSADQVEVNLKTKEATAQGNVVLTQDGAVYKGESVFVDFGNKSAQVSKLKAAMAPRYFGRFDTVRKVGEQYYVAENGYVTTCDDTQCDEQDLPYYRIQSKEVLYYPNDKIIIKHAILRVGNVPFFYIPIMVIPIIEMDRFPIEVEAGRRKEWGAFVLTKMRYNFNPSAKGNILMDYRENQKMAGGIEHFYDTHAFGQGAARYYYADDRCGQENPDCSPGESRLVDETSRYRGQLRHRWQMFPDTAMNAEVNKLSDEFVIQDFFARKEYERIAFPDNYLSVIHSKDDYTLSALSRWQMDDFIGVVERTPEVRFDTHTHPFQDTPFYYRQEAQASHLNLRVKDHEDIHSEANRGDLRHTLSYVWRTDPWTITPFVASRETFYSRDSEGDDRDFVRGNLESGVDASTKFFKIYDASFHAFGTDWNQIRHIITPNIRYRYQSKPTHVKESLYLFDAVDTIDHENFFRFDLQNTLQTKSHDKNGNLAPRELLRTVVFTDLKTPAFDRSRLERVGMDVEFYPYTWLTVHSDAQYQFEADQIDTANIDLVWNREPFWIGFGQRYVKDESNQTTVQVDWKINDIWAIRAYERFEFDDNETDEFEVSLERRNFFCWTVKGTFNYRDGASFFISFSPSSFPESTFQDTQTYRRIDPAIPTSGILTSPDY